MLRDGLPRGGRHRRPRWPRSSRPSPPAPARSRSTPSAPPATATPPAPTSSSCAARAPARALVDPIAFDDLTAAPGGARRRPSGSCTPPARTCPASPRSACGPTALFDTELAGRLLGYPRVGLATLVETRARLPPCARSTPPSTGRRGRCPSRGWSTPRSTSRCSSSSATRWPPSSVEAGKDEWARQEFDAPARLRAARSAPDAWRRTSGMHRARGRRALGAVRALWQARDELAERRDVHPGPDHPRLGDRRGRPRAARRDRAALLALKGFHGRGAERYADPLGRRAARASRACPTSDLPPRRRPVRRTAAAARLGRPRPGRRRPAGHAPGRRSTHCAERAQPPGREPAHPRLPAPACSGTPPEADADDLADALAARLTELGARPWQIELSRLDLLVTAVTAPKPVAGPEQAAPVDGAPAETSTDEA